MRTAGRLGLFFAAIVATLVLASRGALAIEVGIDRSAPFAWDLTAGVGYGGQLPERVPNLRLDLDARGGVRLRTPMKLLGEPLRADVMLGVGWYSTNSTQALRPSVTVALDRAFDSDVVELALAVAPLFVAGRDTALDIKLDLRSALLGGIYVAATGRSGLPLEPTIWTCWIGLDVGPLIVLALL